MTTSPKKTLRVLGFMTGTSLDAVDMAAIQKAGPDIPSFRPPPARKMETETHPPI